MFGPMSAIHTLRTDNTDRAQKISLMKMCSHASQRMAELVSLGRLGAGVWLPIRHRGGTAVDNRGPRIGPRWSGFAIFVHAP